LTPAPKLLLRAALAACALLVLVAVPSAPAATTAHKTTPCWVRLLNDWYDGRIDNIYPIPCYRQAINHLPTDIKQYSNASEEIERALAVAIAHEKNPNAKLPNSGRTTPSGPIPSAIDSSSPGGATSFPLPLVILGGLAIVLLAAGVIGLIIRRRQGDDSGAT
jgi:hypothetical protein